MICFCKFSGSWDIEEIIEITYLDDHSDVQYRPGMMINCQIKENPWISEQFFARWH